MLPPELWDRTLDFLFDDQVALRRCAVVCRDWTPTCIHHIFNELVVVPDHTDAPGLLTPALSYGRLSALAVENPGLLQHVRTFSTSQCTNALNTQVLDTLAVPHAHLKILHIDAQPDVFCEAPLSANLGQLFPHLGTLVLRNVLFDSLAAFTAQLPLLRSLKTLELRHVMFSDPHATPDTDVFLPSGNYEPAGAVDACAVSLAMSNWAPETSLAAFWPWLSVVSPHFQIVSLDLAGVRVLDDGSTDESLGALLTAHAPWLRSLTLGLRDRGGEHARVLPPELAQCTALEHLKIVATTPCLAAEEAADLQVEPASLVSSSPIIPATGTLVMPGPALRCLVGTVADRIGPVVRAGSLKSFNLRLRGVRSAGDFDWDALAALPWSAVPGCACGVGLEFQEDAGTGISPSQDQRAVLDVLRASMGFLRLDVA